MAVPKRKVSKTRVRRRRHAHTVQSARPAVCAECGKPHLPHRACPSCGYYRGRQVLSVEAD